MMYPMMAPTMGSDMLFFWLAIGIVLTLLIVAASIWLVRSAFRNQRQARIQHTSWPQENGHRFEEGYRAGQDGTPTPQTEASEVQYEEEQLLLEYPQERRF